MDLILSKCFDNSIWLLQTRGVSVLCKLALRDASEELSHQYCYTRVVFCPYTKLGNRL